MRRMLTNGWKNWRQLDTTLIITPMRPSSFAHWIERILLKQMCGCYVCWIQVWKGPLRVSISYLKLVSPPATCIKQRSGSTPWSKPACHQMLILSTTCWRRVECMIYRDGYAWAGQVNNKNHGFWRCAILVCCPTRPRMTFWPVLPVQFAQLWSWMAASESYLLSLSFAALKIGSILTIRAASLAGAVSPTKRLGGYTVRLHFAKFDARCCWP